MQAFEKVKKAIEEIKQGKMVVVVDDENRENEGDLCMAAQAVTPAAINFMAKYGRGLICLSLSEEIVEKLELPMMVDTNRASRSTAFTVSIEATEGVSTGISAADRAHTVLTAVAKDAKPKDIVSPGHIFPLKGKPGGVLQRTGHTEGSIDLARLAGFESAGVICEIMKDDGTMARYDDLIDFSKAHGLTMISIEDLIQYRLQTESLIQCLDETEVSMPSGKMWSAKVFQVGTEQPKQFLAMTFGTLLAEPTLVRVHTCALFKDIFGAKCGTRVDLKAAISKIEEEGSGVVLLIPNQSNFLQDLKTLKGSVSAKHGTVQSSETTVQSPEQGEVLREYGFGAQVLSSLGLREIRLLTSQKRRIPSLEGYGLRVVEQLLMNPSTK